MPAERISAEPLNPVDQAVNTAFGLWQKFSDFEETPRSEAELERKKREIHLTIADGLPLELRNDTIVGAIAGGTRVISLDSYEGRPIYETAFNDALLELSADMSPASADRLYRRFEEIAAISENFAEDLVVLAGLTIMADSKQAL